LSLFLKSLHSLFSTLERWFSLSLSYIFIQQVCLSVSQSVTVANFFSTPPIQLKLQVGGRLLISTHLDQSNHLANEKQGVVNKYVLTLFIRLFQSSSMALKAVDCLRVLVVSPWIHWIWLMNNIQDFQCKVTYWALMEMLLLPHGPHLIFGTSALPLVICLVSNFCYFAIFFSDENFKRWFLNVKCEFSVRIRNFFVK
jgi:hypothetical protein